MPVLDGVRLGPLDPDQGERFGQVGGQTTARQLVRHHNRMLPPAVRTALTRQRNAPRSLAIDEAEVRKAIEKAYKEAGEPLPDEAELSGFGVHGDEDAPSQMVLGFTYGVQSGRTGKGFIPYTRDALPRSVKAGDAAAAREKLRAQGIVQTVGAVSASPEAKAAARGDDDALQARVEELEAQLAELPEQMAQALAAQLAGAENGDAAAATDAGPDGGEPEEPWRGYEKANSKDIQKRLRDRNDPELARQVVAYEEQNAKRSGVTSVANAIIDRDRA